MIKNYKLKIILVLLVIGSFAALLIGTDLFSTQTADAAWYSSGGVWTNRKMIATDPQKVGSTTTAYLNNFPMLVSVTDADLKFTSFGGNVASSTGGDILFTTGDGATALNYEIEYYASTTGQLIAWVQIPFLSSTSTTPLYIYYGNASAPNNQNPAGTWDSNYKGVLHLKEDPTTTCSGTKEVCDSTSNNKHSDALNMESTDQTSGKIGGALSFNESGTGEYTELGAPWTTATTNITLSAWVYSRSSSQNDKIVYNGHSGNSGYGLYHSNGACGAGTEIGMILGGLTCDVFSSTTNMPQNSWTYIVATRGATTWTLYLNGVAIHTGTTAPNTPADYGRIADAGTLNAIVDEVRISSSARSADWIKTEYNNQNSPNTFYAYSGQEQENKTAASTKLSNSATVAGAPGWYNGAWGYRKRITIDNQKVASTTGSNITNFPVLVSVTDADLKFTDSGGKVGSSTAGDILFTTGDGATALNYEIEKYASTTGELVAWVNIPFLSSTSTIPIYMYFGNTSAPNVAASTWQNTWDSNYEGVWHLPNGTTLTANDSTSNAENGTITGSTATAGKIDGAGNFDGNDKINFTDNDDIDGVSALTLSLWTKRGTAASYSHIINKRSDSGVSGFSLQEGGFNYGDEDDILFCISTGSTCAVGFTTLNFLSTTAFSHIVAVFDGSQSTNATRLKIYVNGAQATLSFIAQTIPASTVANAYAVLFGESGDNGEAHYIGVIDEGRISKSVRSADWIKTEYRNQSSPSTFYSYGGLEGQSGRVDSSGVTIPAVKARGGVKFR